MIGRRQREGCSDCRTPPLYTNNKLTLAKGDHEIAGMNYFSTAVVAWFDNPALAQLIVNLTVQANNVLEGSYLLAGSPVADVEAAFSTTDFSLTPSGVPLNVARICQWTWTCTPFENAHPNAAGYAVIAQAFQQVLP